MFTKLNFTESPNQEFEGIYYILNDEGDFEPALERLDSSVTDSTCHDIPNHNEVMTYQLETDTSDSPICENEAIPASYGIQNHSEVMMSEFPQKCSDSPGEVNCRKKLYYLR